MTKFKFGEKSPLKQILKKTISNEEIEKPFLGLRQEATSEIKKIEEPYEKITLLVSASNIAKVRAMAFWSKKTIKQITNESLKKTIKSYERKSGELKIP